MRNNPIRTNIAWIHDVLSNWTNTHCCQRGEVKFFFEVNLLFFSSPQRNDVTVEIFQATMMGGKIVHVTGFADVLFTKTIRRLLLCRCFIFNFSFFQLGFLKISKSLIGFFELVASFPQSKLNIPLQCVAACRDGVAWQQLFVNFVNKPWRENIKVFNLWLNLTFSSANDCGYLRMVTKLKPGSGATSLLRLRSNRGCCNYYDFTKNYQLPRKMFCDGQWCGRHGVQPHPQKFWFVENPGKIPENLG